MDRGDLKRGSDRRDESAGPQLVTVPSAHAGVERALRTSFDQSSPLPDEWSRLLGRLR